MFKDILNLLMGDAPNPEPMGSQQAELAIAALLVRVARSDDNYDDAERMRIDPDFQPVTVTEAEVIAVA